MSKIQSLKIRHIKGARNIDLHNINQDAVVIGGRNGAGKSSLFDAICIALEDVKKGKKRAGNEVITHGENKGEVCVETEELVVKRVFKSGSNPRLKAERKDGGKLKQSDLDGLYGDFSFDPPAFCKLSADKQKEAIERLMPEKYKDHLAKLDQSIKETFDKRSDYNRDLKRMGIIDTVEKVDRVDVSAIAAELKSAKDANQKVYSWQSEERTKKATIDHAVQEIALIEKRLQEWRAKHTLYITKLNDLGTCPEEVDTSALEGQLATASAQNEKADAYDRCMEKIKERSKISNNADAAESELEDLREQRDKFSLSVDLPIKGAELTEEGIRVNGVLFDQLSGAEKILAACQFGVAQNPNLRVLFIRDGGSLDELSLQSILKFGKENNYQIWIERPNPNEDDAIIIEAGELKEVQF